MYMEKPVANGNGLSLCSFKPTKQSLDSLSAKTLLTLDLKYYEKNSLQI